jgi:hypothetical protein
MHKELRRSLCAAALAAAALGGCEGKGSDFGSSPSPGPSPSPSPSPSPPPAAAGSYFVTGHAGVGLGSGFNAIAFFDSPQALDLYPLVVTDPLARTPAATQFEAGATTLDVANLSEWFPSGGNATAWGIRYRIYAKHISGNVDNLYEIDLRKSGSSPSTPAPTQLSTAVIAGTGSQPPLCWVDHQVFDNYRSADRSWIVFHAHGANDNRCGTADDQFVAVEASMGATSPPLVLTENVSGQSMPNQLQPVEALYDSTGLITGFLAISHPPVNVYIQPATPVPLVQLDTSMAVVKTFAQTLSGAGVTGGSGDFISLGVSTGGTWLYKGSSDIWAVDIASNMSTRVYTIAPGDIVHGRAVFDGTTAAYVAINNRATGGYVLQIDLSSKAHTVQPPDTAATGGIDLVGVTSANVVYLLTDRTAIKALNKASLSNTAAVLFAASGTLSVDGPLGAPIGTSPVAYLVQNEVFFTVADFSSGNKLAYTASAGSAPTTAAAIGAGSGAVLGTVAAAFATSGAVVNSGALVVTGGALSTSLTFSGGALSSYGPTGILAAPISLGTLPTTTLALAPLDVSTIPMQAGMPSMLEMTGNNAGVPVNDVGVFVAGTAGSFKRLTSNMQ